MQVRFKLGGFDIKLQTYTAENFPTHSQPMSYFKEFSCPHLTLTNVLLKRSLPISLYYWSHNDVIYEKELLEMLYIKLEILMSYVPS